ncbi:tetratricopeptide repeat protein [Hyphomicrobium sp. NDB2Meth4]|uniref:tetratricopeptide repeat protein n=1 Tax=Hyphomicrobium sp. NDB2Meth4 TaxID=1892846 RepID=UPI000930180F|nr:tetratricopeptide repeat protein [Hyphomicrobium sp. NDB2Meth4]
MAVQIVRGLRHCRVALVILAIGIVDGAAAATIEVAPGVHVTKTTFPAPINQQPFYGFAELTPHQRAANEEFVAKASQAAGSREKAFEETIRRAWNALLSGNFSEATKRFNQSYLIDPGQSQVFHGLGLIAFERFRNAAFADELLRIARARPNPAKLLNADYGRFLLLAGRPQDAEPVLEQAVVDAPNFATAWSNLAWARLHNGKTKAACAAAMKAEELSPPPNVSSDLAMLRSSAGCT